MKMMNISKNEFISLCDTCFRENGIEEFCTADILEALFQMTENLLRVNASMNLTAITEPHDIIVKHLTDSLSAAKFIPEDAKLLDVGCGGGFPSLPLAIARPDLRITALDSTAKKTAYVAEAAKLLSLSNLQTLTGRAEELAQEPQYRETFDVVIARAVAALPVLSELCLPFVRIGGKMIAMKAKLDESEQTKAWQHLGAAPFHRHEFQLMGGKTPEERLILETKKHSSTPKAYPRAYAQIKKKPL